MCSGVSFENLNLRTMVRLIFSEMRFGLTIAEYPKITLFFSRRASLCLTALSVIVYPKS